MQNLAVEIMYMDNVSIKYQFPINEFQFSITTEGRNKPFLIITKELTKDKSLQSIYGEIMSKDQEVKRVYAYLCMGDSKLEVYRAVRVSGKNIILLSYQNRMIDDKYSEVITVSEDNPIG